MGAMRTEIGSGRKSGPMVCDKCGFGYMIDDSHYDIKVYRCWTCGNRVYIDYPKRSGSFVCTRCGGDLDNENALSYCSECLRLLDIHLHRSKERTYGETVCACGTTFMKKSPTHTFHSKHCRTGRT